MGSGDFGSNGSVHWHIQHTGGGGGKGRDPVPYGQIGNPGGHPSRFRVRLRFPDESSAKAALANAQVTPSGMVTIDVPKTEPERPTPNPPEVSVHW